MYQTRLTRIFGKAMRNIFPLLGSREPTRDKWEEYGARKAEIVAVAGSTEEYDQMMKELLDELGL